MDRRFVGFALAQGLVSASMFAYISGSSFVVQNIYGGTPQTFSLTFAINGIGIMLASQTTGRLAGKVAELKLLIIGLSMSIIGAVTLLILLLLYASLILVLTPLFFVVSSVGIVNTAGFSLVM